MPEIKHFVVHQTRKVHVRANSATEAAIIAEEAFAKPMVLNDGTFLSKVDVKPWGNANRVEETGIIISQES